ncbi:MAG: radical SAM protein [Clostridia bacterium]|nr:radical SAM protein [Clostridia bacterium]
MSSELSQRPVWSQLGPYRVTSELFLDLVFTSACNCACPWCIARTTAYAKDDLPRWEKALTDAFRLFDVRSVIILGGEATIDPQFWRKLARVEAMIGQHPVEHLILTTNGIKLRDEDFAGRLLHSRVDAVNLSRMHHDQQVNDCVFGSATMTREEIAVLHQRLRDAGKTLRLNVNVWRGNLDTPQELERFVQTFAGCCDAIKFTPLMDTEMFDTVEEVNRCTKAWAIPETEIRALWDAFASRHEVLGRAGNILGFVDYAEIDAYGQRVILKYAQVEDKYDRDSVIPTLKLYPNGCLSNEWSFRRDVRDRL